MYISPAMMLFGKIALAVLLVFGLMAAPLVYHYSQGNLSAMPLPPKTKTDVIMVFTGSSDRLVQGYQSYLRGLGKRLMITGYDYPRDASKPDIKKLSRKVKKDKVYIDLTAKNTIENAQNGAEWAIKNHVKSIVLVTAKEHMPRAYFELRRLLPPSVKVYTNTVPGKNLDYPGMDSEKGRLMCRLYETATGTSFCYKTRNLVRTLEAHLS